MMMRHAAAVLVAMAVCAGAASQPGAQSVPKMSNAAISAAVIKLEAVYRKDLPNNATDAQKKALAKSQDDAAKAILNDLVNRPAGQIDFIVDEVIEHTKPDAPKHVQGGNPVGDMFNEINKEDADRKAQQFIANRFEIHAHIEWKSTPVLNKKQKANAAIPQGGGRRGRSGPSADAQSAKRAAVDDRVAKAVPTQRVIVFSNDDTVGDWVIGSHRTMNVAPEHADSSISNVEVSYVSGEQTDSIDLAMVEVKDPTAAYVGLTVTVREVPLPKVK